jgi:hypothetical protein
MSVSQSKKDVHDTTPDDALVVVHRDLTGIYASIAESLKGDPEIVPWTLRELRGVLDYIQAVQKAEPPSTAR